MADQLADLVKKNGDRLARQIIAGAATTTPNLLEQPGDQTDRWKHNLVANPWQPHLDLDQDNVLVPHGDPWPATNANGTSPAIPQGHYGCRRYRFKKRNWRRTRCSGPWCPYAYPM